MEREEDLNIFLISTTYVSKSTYRVILPLESTNYSINKEESLRVITNSLNFCCRSFSYDARKDDV